MTAIIEEVRTAVSRVDDPELPGVSIADLGVLDDVNLEGETVVVSLLPTFLGCPALAEIEEDVRGAAESASGGMAVEVRFESDPPWTPDRINARGRAALGELTIAVLRTAGPARCPVCSSTQTEVRSPFGPTACRAIGYCNNCRNPIEIVRR